MIAGFVFNVVKKTKTYYKRILKLQHFFCFVFVFKTWPCSMAQAGLQHKILLLQAPKYWDYTFALPHLAQCCKIYQRP
jgi:hypothetical protein